MAHPAFPNVQKGVAESSFIALAVEAEISEDALQWLLKRGIKKSQDLALCALSESHVWQRIIKPMQLPESDLAAPARLVAMWEMARARRITDSSTVIAEKSTGDSNTGEADAVTQNVDPSKAAPEMPTSTEESLAEQVADDNSGQSETDSSCRKRTTPDHVASCAPPESPSCIGKAQKQQEPSSSVKASKVRRRGGVEERCSAAVSQSKAADPEEPASGAKAAKARRRGIADEACNSAAGQSKIADAEEKGRMEDREEPPSAKVRRLGSVQTSLPGAGAPKTEPCHNFDQEQLDAEDAEGDDVDERPAELEDLYESTDELLEIAKTTWMTEDEGPMDMGSKSFDVSSLKGMPDGRMPFKIVAMALEHYDSDAPRILRALTNSFRWALQKSSDRRADLSALLALLVAPPTPHPQITAAVGTQFQLKTSIGSSMTAYYAPLVSAESLPDLALKGRKSQRTLFGNSANSVSVAEVAGILDPSAGQNLAITTPDHHRQSEPFTRLLKKATHDYREIWHLVRVFQGNPGMQRSIVLRALAHAYHFVCNDGATQPEMMVTLEKVLFRAWAERGLEPNWIVNKLLPQNGPLLSTEELDSAAVVASGVWVRPMKPHEASCLEEALDDLDKFNPGALRAEWLMDGHWVQVHVNKGGEHVQVFEAHGLCTNTVAFCTEHADEVAAILKGNLKSAQDAILEVSLMWTGPANEGKARKVHSVVIFDALMLGGNDLTRKPLRARRAELEAMVTETSLLRLAPGVELPLGAEAHDAAKAELARACGAEMCTSKDADAKKALRAMGLVIKALDGPLAVYYPGSCVPFWQSLSKPPAIEGPKAEAALFDILSDAERAVLPDPEEFHFCVVSARRTQTAEGRKDILLVQKQFKAAGVSPRWYVDADSLAGYRSLGLDAVVGGKLIPARNMALDDAEKLGKACVQSSDDIEKWQYLMEPGGWKKKGSLAEANALARLCVKYQVTPVAAARFILAKMRGNRDKPQLGGVLPHHNPGQSMNLTPFSFAHFIVGDFFVVDKSPCRFDDRMTLKEDYDLTCAHLKTHGSVVRCNHMLIFAKHETNAGGAVSVRDAQGKRERENIQILKEKYPCAFIDNAKRPNQVRLEWRGYMAWVRKQAVKS